MLQNLRSWLNNRRPLVAGVCAVLAVLAVVLIVSGFFGSGGGDSRRKPIVKVYYYNLNDGKLFEADRESISPMAAPGQGASDEPAGVRAYVYSCTNCADASTHFVGWLERYTPEARQTLLAIMNKAPTPQQIAAVEQGHQIRAEADGEWIRANHPDAAMIKRTVDERCQGKGRPRACTPG